MPECAYRLCDIEFEIDPHQRGNKQRFCCRKHGRYENWHIYHDRKAKKQTALNKKQQKARKYAILHCVEYLKCLDKSARNGNKLNCYQCKEINIKHNAFKDELEEITYDTDENPIHLP